MYLLSVGVRVLLGLVSLDQVWNTLYINKDQ
jgi:hypothetical protein